MSKRETQLWLIDMETAIRHILEFTEGVDYDLFCSNMQLKHAVLHNFTIIGEASTKISEEYKVLHPNIPWREIRGFRNYVVHEYFGLDDSIVWHIIQHDLIELYNGITQLLKE